MCVRDCVIVCTVCGSFQTALGLYEREISKMPLSLWTSTANTFDRHHRKQRVSEENTLFSCRRYDRVVTGGGTAVAAVLWFWFGLK